MNASGEAMTVAGLRCHQPAGAGPLRGRDVVVLLHGVGASGRQMLPLAGALPSRLAPIAIDLPGHGDSPMPEDDSPRALAMSVLAVVDALATRRVWLLGHSFGGFLALLAASLWRGRLAGLVLVATTARLRLHPELIDRVAGRRFDLDWVRATTGGVLDDDLVRLIADDFGRMQLPRGRQSMEAWTGADLREALPGIAAPALVVKPDVDSVISPRQSDDLARALPQARLLCLPGGGHYLALSRAAELAGAVAAFTEACETAAPPALDPVQAAS